LRRRGLLFQLRQSAERLGCYVGSPLVIANFEQIGAAGPLQPAKLLQKIRVQPGLLAYK
jgi:hypothetical protein